MSKTFFSTRQLIKIFCGICILLMSLAACNGSGGTYPTDIFIPSTRIPTQPPPTPSPTNPAAPTAIPTATAAAVCTPNLTFLNDLTLPDGSEVQPGEVLDKRWQVQNSGDCNWDDSYHLKLVAGTTLNAPEEQALYPARGGTEATVRILFTAPIEAGEYRSAWQAHDPDGQPFGDLIYVVIIVP